MAKQTDLISMADIARLAGQTRATVGNWKSRNPDDFPAERAKGTRGPLYDRDEVTAWLAASGRLAVKQSETAVLHDLIDRFRGAVPVEDVIPLLLVLLYLRTKAASDWIELKHATPNSLDDAVRRATAVQLPEALDVLPRYALPAAPTAAAIGALDRIAASRAPIFVDAALELAASILSRRGGEFLSPESVRRLVVELADPVGTVYNPASGAGQLLADAGALDASLTLIGQEINAATRQLSLLVLSLRGVNADVALGDIFSEDRFPSLRADTVIAVPPWNSRISAVDDLSEDPRWVWGEPGPRDGNAAWIQHCLFHLSDNGRAVLVLPKGALFEEGRAGRIRQRIVKAGLLDAVVALPGGLFAWTALPCAIAVFRKNRVQARQAVASTLMVDLTALGSRRDRTMSTISEELIRDVGSVYRRWTAGIHPDVPYASVATFDEIASNDFVIDPSRYLALPTADPTVRSRVSHLPDLVDRLSALDGSLRSLEVWKVPEVTTTPTPHMAEVRMGDLVPTVLQIARGFPSQRARSDGEFPVLSIAALRSAADARHRADQLDLDDLGLELAQPGDVLVAVEGGTVGEVAVVSDDIEPFVPSQQAATLRVVDTEQVDAWFLGAWLTTPAGSEQLRRLARGAGILRIAMKDLHSLAVPLPPIGIQRQIGRRYRQLERAAAGYRSLSKGVEELCEIEIGSAFAKLLDN